MTVGGCLTLSITARLLSTHSTSHLPKITTHTNTHTHTHLHPKKGMCFLSGWLWVTSSYFTLSERLGGAIDVDAPYVLGNRRFYCVCVQCI